jgi:hypothetical protein
MTMVTLPEAPRRNDVSSAYGQFGLAVAAALENEFIHGMKALAAKVAPHGPALFAAGTAAGQDCGRIASVLGIK